MKLDTHLSFGEIHRESGSKFTKQILAISEHTLSRNATKAWVDNLQFVAVPTEQRSEIASGKKNSGVFVKVEEKRDVDYDSSTGDGGDPRLGCDCNHWPKFTSAELPYLALTDYGAVQNCNHYVAVSYCWKRGSASWHKLSPNPKVSKVEGTDRELRPRKKQRLNPESTDNAPERPYDIMTSRGIRRGRAPRDVMDRAIRYAAKRGVSFIWIDQECISQDDPHAKELAIQSMHLVYRQSEFPLGLLTAKLVRQEHVNALNFAVRYSGGQSSLRDDDARSQGFLGTPGRERPVQSFVRSLAEVLKILSRDRWLARGWIMQEMVLAGEKIVFSIPCLPAIKKPIWGGTINGELHMTLEEMVPIIDDVLSSDEKAREIDKLLSNRGGPGSVAWKFYESFRKLRHLTLGTNSDGDTQMFGYYRVCNALAAVLYLEGRSNSKVSDRLAIVANLCDYNVRLNSTKLDELGFDYSTCLFTLMLLNGDISYLIEWDKAASPSAIDNHTKRKTISPLGNEWNRFETFSWMPHPQASFSLSLTYDEFIDDGELALSTIMDPIMKVVEPGLTGHGLHLRGWMWRVNMTTELKDFQEELKRSWRAIRSKAERLDDFTPLIREAAQLVMSLLLSLLKSADSRDLILLLWDQLVLVNIESLDELDFDVKPEPGDLPETMSPEELKRLASIVSGLHHRVHEDNDKSILYLQKVHAMLINGWRGKTATPPEMDWLFNLILAQGHISWGRAAHSPASSSDSGYRKGDRSRGVNSGTGSANNIAIFDCDVDARVLTPQIHDPTKNETEKKEWIRHLHRNPVSWFSVEAGADEVGPVMSLLAPEAATVTKSSTTTVRSVPCYKTQGMLRGLWKIGRVPSSPYILK